VFYLKYDMYRNAWPLLAMATYQQLTPAVAPEEPAPATTS